MRPKASQNCSKTSQISSSAFTIISWNDVPLTTTGMVSSVANFSRMGRFTPNALRMTLFTSWLCNNADVLENYWWNSVLKHVLLKQGSIKRHEKLQPHWTFAGKSADLSFKGKQVNCIYSNRTAVELKSHQFIVTSRTAWV